MNRSEQECRNEYQKKHFNSLDRVFWTVLAGLSLGLSFAVWGGLAQELHGQETSEKELSEKEWKDAVQLMETTVEINSGTFNPKGIEAVSQIYAQRLEKLGFKVWSEDMAKVQRGAHLFAEKKSTRPDALRILLIGHLDTVFEPFSPFQKLETLAPGKVKGPGVVDMKGGNAVLMKAVQLFLESSASADSGLSIAIAFLADEEAPGQDPDGSRESTRKTLIELAKGSDIALGYETGTDLGRSATVARRGFAKWQLNIEAKRGHSSLLLSKDAGPGAIYPLATILDRIHRFFAGEKYLTINTGAIGGGYLLDSEKEGNHLTVSGRANVIPDRAQVIGDMRYISMQQFKKSKLQIENIIQNTVQEFNSTGTSLVSFKVNFQPGMPAMSPTQSNHDLLEIFSKVSQKAGLGKVAAYDPMKRGAADISFVAPHVKAAMDGLGPDGGGDHSMQEWMDLNTFKEAIQRNLAFFQYLSKNCKKGFSCESDS